eukprot:TRINITY_DN11288_c0_g1_i1.p1 TRINITY_DN11288_c0_g1~~TRINITY_DN11288_c0_g1_i1.p1  ORF type:complete len:121 (+),score=38.58 TRINITY_DN11288_c0_g1_i1:125-487(+)
MCIRDRSTGNRAPDMEYQQQPSYKRPHGEGDLGPSTKRGRDGMTRVTLRCPSIAAGGVIGKGGSIIAALRNETGCLLYTSDAADDLLCVDLGGRRSIKKKKHSNELSHNHSNVRKHTKTT